MAHIAPMTPLPPGATLGPRDEGPRARLSSIAGALQTWPLVTWARAFLARHGRKLWWLHSAYALALGTGVVLFAQKGFDHARFLAVGGGVAWLVMLLFFRRFGTGAAQDQATAWPGARLRFLVMTYVLKNLYQGMLFFLLPFYWKAASFGTHNFWFFVLLVVSAGLSTLDIVFDRVLMRWKILASLFYAVTLFACLNLVIPALLPDVPTRTSLSAAAATSALGFFTLHFPLGALKRPAAALGLAACVAASVGIADAARSAIPPVPMHVSSGAVGPAALPDGRLAMTVDSLDHSVLTELMAVTDVVVPGGKGDQLLHVWKLDGRVIHRSPEGTSRVRGPDGAIRLRSFLRGAELPAEKTGAWSVDVETEDGQLVGRAVFQVTE